MPTLQRISTKDNQIINQAIGRRTIHEAADGDDEHNKKQAPAHRRVKNGCWLCEGWQEIKFEWMDSKILQYYNMICIVQRLAQKKEQEQPVYIHFEFDDFEGDVMVKE